MIKYIITSEAFTGEALLFYDDNAERPIFNCLNTNMSAGQHKWLMCWICENAITQSALMQTLSNSKTDIGSLKFKQVHFEPTFVDFWTAYFKNRHKDNSSKKTAEKRWEKMTKSGQLAAYNYVPRYFLQIPAGTQTKLAETYLSSEVWVR
ncbi:MAG: hypothetical protein FWC34_11020 [Bacteroidetes bacterium]|nr:hypothetical protein [Bacteroidota bacterium]MCL2302927.1 hypothetical protein [Lentimicrobiaceae bacterium]